MGYRHFFKLGGHLNMKILPRYLIHKLAIPTGLRLDKRVRLVPSYVGTTFHTNFGRRDYFPQVETTTGDLWTPQIKHNEELQFDTSEYRFWCVEIRDQDSGIPSTAVCRACEQIHFRKTVRQKHQETVGCTKRLIKAYELLLRDKRCVICDAHTQNRKWGVPLCNTRACTQKWCQVEPQPIALYNALELVPAVSEERVVTI